MATYTYIKPYAQLDERKLRDECVASGLPVTDVQRLGDPAQTIYVITDRDLTSPEISTLDTIVSTHDGRLRRPRPVFAIYNDLTLLTSTQTDAIIADLEIASLTGKWTTLKPPQDAPAAALRWSAISLSGATSGEKRQAAGWICAMFCQQNPLYLVNPTFHASLSGVNIPGDEVIS